MQANTTDIKNITKNLTMIENGIWISDNRRDISYPAEGHDICFGLEDESFWFRHRNNCIVEMVKRYPPPGTIFDVGGGNGFVTLGLKKAGYDAILVEPGIVGARNAISRGICPVICSTLEDAGFHEGSMPAIGLFDVLEHIEDDVSFLIRIRSLLVPCGRLYATVPAYNSLWSTEDDFAGHYRRYTLKCLEDKLRSAGFEIEYATYFFTLLTAPIFLFRVIPGKLGFRTENKLSRQRNEHGGGTKLIHLPLHAYLGLELLRLKKGKIRFGASCMIVARVKNK